MGAEVEEEVQEGRAKKEKTSGRCRVRRSNKADGEKERQKQEIKKILQTVLSALRDTINLLFKAEDGDIELRSTFPPRDRLQTSRRSRVACKSFAKQQNNKQFAF